MLKKVFFSFLFLSFTFFIKAQVSDSIPIVNYSNPQEYIIDTVIVTGTKYLDEKVLISMSGLEQGAKITIPGDGITKPLKKFWDNGLFEDVKIKAAKITNGKVTIELHFVERPRLAKLVIDGVSKSDKEDLMEKVNLRPGSQITENTLNNTVGIIKKHYIEKGFFNVDVKVDQKTDTASHNRVTVNLKVKKNKRVKINDIYFNGNNTMSDRKLRKAMKDTKRRDWNIFNSSKYIETKYKDDKEKLIDFYNERGYRDAKIIADSIVDVYPHGEFFVNADHELDYRVVEKLQPKITRKIHKKHKLYFNKFWFGIKTTVDTIVKIEPKKRINIYISLKEGHKYYFRNIKWVGNTKYPTELLESSLGIKKGDIFDQKLLDKRLQTDEDAVSSIYLDNGYLFSQINPVETTVDNDSIDFEMRVYEGKQARINNIFISGNTKTNEHVVRRELRTLPGELFSKSDIIRTVRELANLGHFEPEKIEPEPIPHPENSTVDIRYKLVERANDQLEISGGWGGYYGFIGTVGLKFSNFSARNLFKLKEWRPVPSGDGQTLSLRVQASGVQYRSFSVSFVEPWLGGKKPNSLSVSLFYSRYYYPSSSSSSYYTDLTTSDQTMLMMGGTLGLGRRLTWPDDYFVLQNELSYELYVLNNYRSYYGFNNGRVNNLSFSTTISRNSLDQMIYPRRGSSFSLKFQLTPPYSLFKKKYFWKYSTDEINNLSTDDKNNLAELELARKYNWIEYHKWSFKADNYISLVGNLVLMTRAQFGMLSMYNSSVGYPPFEGFDVGGSGMSYQAFYNTEIVGLRGYEDGSITPYIDANGNKINSTNGTKAGNLYDKFTAELRYPITLKEQATVYGEIFVEAGNAFHKAEAFNPFLLKRSVGFGIRAFLPMLGMIGFDFGRGFDKQYTNNPQQDNWQVHFTLGQMF